MMYFKMIPDSQGDYVDAAGNCYFISAVKRIRTREGVNTGYESFGSQESALSAWKLTLKERRMQHDCLYS